MLFRFFGDEATVAAVRLTRDRVDDVADQKQRLVGKDRVDRRRIGVGDEQHVALVDRLEAANARAVESKTLAETVLFQLSQREAEVLPRTRQVDEADVDDLDALCLRAFDDLTRACLAA